MPLLDELLKIERKLWTDGADAYRKHVDERCLVAFGRAATTMSNEEVAATVQDGQRWKEPELEVKGMIEPAAGVALLTYQADAIRSTGEAYKAVVSSGYVKRGDSWKLAFHQQTPL